MTMSEVKQKKGANPVVVLLVVAALVKGLVTLMDVASPMVSL